MKLNPFRKESLKRYLGTDKHFAKTLGAFDLLTIGIGAVIGTGIFILPGTVAAKEAGPGVTLSFLVAALVCTLASMCYAELSSSIPVAGSAYSYGNILYGEVIGWILGWALILEYMLSVAAVSAGWASYFNSLLHSFGLHIPHHFEGPFDPLNGTYLNLWAVISVLLIGIIGTLIVAALLYMGVSVVLTGMVNYKQLDVANPVAYALKLVNQGWVADLLSIGAIVGMSTMMLTMIYSSSRLIYSIGRDGLLPNFLGKIDKHGLPENALWIVTIVIALMGGLFSLEELTSLVSIGTLLAFTFVSFGVILLRRRKDIPEGDFKVPFYPIIPILSGLACIGMMCFLSVKTYIFAGIWFLFGLFIYCVYGYKHSKISKRNN